MTKILTAQASALVNIKAFIQQEIEYANVELINVGSDPIVINDVYVENSSAFSIDKLDLPYVLHPISYIHSLLLTLSYTITKIFYHNKTLFIADDDKNLYTYDFDGTTWALVSTNVLEDDVTAIDAFGTTVICAIGEKGIKGFVLNPDSTLTEGGTAYLVADEAVDVAIQRNFIVCLYKFTGLRIYSYNRINAVFQLVRTIPISDNNIKLHVVNTDIFVTTEDKGVFQCSLSLKLVRSNLADPIARLVPTVHELKIATYPISSLLSNRVDVLKHSVDNVLLIASSLTLADVSEIHCVYNDDIFVYVGTDHGLFVLRVVDSEELIIVANLLTDYTIKSITKTNGSIVVAKSNTELEIIDIDSTILQPFKKSILVKFKPDAIDVYASNLVVKSNANTITYMLFGQCYGHNSGIKSMNYDDYVAATMMHQYQDEEDDL